MLPRHNDKLKDLNNSKQLSYAIGQFPDLTVLNLPSESILNVISYRIVQNVVAPILLDCLGSTWFNVLLGNRDTLPYPVSHQMFEVICYHGNIDRHLDIPAYRNDTITPYPPVRVIAFREYYTARDLPIRNHEAPSSKWLRDMFRYNVIYTIGDLCLLTAECITICTCPICSNFEAAEWFPVTHVSRFNGVYFIRAVISSTNYCNMSSITLMDERLVDQHDRRERHLFRQSCHSTRSPAVSNESVQSVVTSPPETSLTVANQSTSIVQNVDWTDATHDSRRNDSSDVVHIANMMRVHTKVIDINNKTYDPFDKQFYSGQVQVGDDAPREIASDGGCTNSMFSDEEVFTNYEPRNDIVVRMANNTTVRASGVGDVGKLKRVLHVKGLVFDLVSESQCDKLGMKGTWGGGIRQVFDRNGSIFYSARLKHNLYIINPVTLNIMHPKYVTAEDFCMAANDDAQEKLHRAMGHLGGDRIERCVKSGHLPWNHNSCAIS